MKILTIILMECYNLPTLNMYLEGDLEMYSVNSMSPAAIAFAGSVGLIVIIAILLLSFGGALALSIIFFSRKRYENSVGRPALNWFFRFLNFDMFIFSTIAKFCYMFITILMMLLSLVVIFTGQVVGGLVAFIASPVLVRIIYELVYIVFGMRDQLASINLTLLEMKKSGSAMGGVPAAPAPAAPVAPAPVAPVPAAPVAPAPVVPTAPAAPEAPVRPAPAPVRPAPAPAPQRPAPVAPQRPAAPAPQQRPAPQPAPQQAARRFCPKCGREVKPGAPFCSNCGTKM